MRATARRIVWRSDTYPDEEMFETPPSPTSTRTTSTPPMASARPTIPRSAPHLIREAPAISAGATGAGPGPLIVPAFGDQAIGDVDAPTAGGSEARATCTLLSSSGPPGVRRTLGRFGRLGSRRPRDPLTGAGRSEGEPRDPRAIGDSVPEGVRHARRFESIGAEVPDPDRTRDPILPTPWAPRNALARGFPYPLG